MKPTAIRPTQQEIEKAFDIFLTNECFKTLALETILQSVKRRLSKRNPSSNPTSKRSMPAGWKKVNRGFFNNLRSYLSDASKERDTLSFGEVFETMKFFHPDLPYRKCFIYLSDKRRLPGVKFDGKAKIVKLRMNTPSVEGR